MRTITPTRTRRPYEAAELVRYKRIETELNRERMAKNEKISHPKGKGV